MSWYRQYRPTTVAELHLATVRQTLQQMMAHGHLPHAFLFAGPKGTGKTSLARIIAAMLNDQRNQKVVEQLFLAPTSKTASSKLVFQEPDQDNELVQRIQRGSSYVVTELDAASNRGIDDIRQLKERIYVPPAEGLVSVYILDEAHMLTTEAFNALLKILEEPPAQVVFILATTELHKIPETIVSRCTLIQFHKASLTEISEALAQILKTEKIAYEAEALTEIAQAADGSFRDAVKLLEIAAMGQEKVTSALVRQITQGAQKIQIPKLLSAIVEKQAQQVTQFFIDLRQVDLDPKFFYTQLMTHLHQELLLAITEGDAAAEYSAKILHYLLNQFSAVSLETSSSIPFLSIELKALEMIFKAKEKGGTTNASGMIKKSTPPLPNNDVELVTTVSVMSAPIIDLPDTISTSAPQQKEIFINPQQLIEKWDDFLSAVQQKNSSIAAMLGSSKPLGSEGEKAKVEVYYQFHREQLQQPKFRSLLEECAMNLFGGRVNFEFLLAESARPGAKISSVSGQVNEEDKLIQLAKEILV